MDAMLTGLNAAQLDAVTNIAPVVQILAPPGSGKTRTLTLRIAHLLSHPHSYKPENIIVATFTVKAANEMKSRISDLLSNSGRGGMERKLVLGTFHSIARRYLIKYGHLIALKQGWGIADSGDSSGIVKRIIKRRGFPLEPGQVRNRISHFKARDLSPAAGALPQQRATQATQATQEKRKDMATEDFVHIYSDYEAALEASNLLDYDDLLLRCVALLKQYPECVDNVEAVLIDEFQDTNTVQFQLMILFSQKRHRVTIVGDPDQSIYGFRAAEVRNLHRMRRVWPETVVVHLEENYRSSASILMAALEVIEQDDSRPKKPLLPTHQVGVRPVLRRIPSAGAEASWLVAEILRIRAMTGGMVELGDIAVLVRSASLTRILEGAMTRVGMKYKMVGGLRFFDRVEVKVLLDYLRVLQNLANNDALARVINVPSRKVGDLTVKGLVEEAEKKGKSVWELIVRGSRGGGWGGCKMGKVAEKGLAEFVNTILITRKMLDEEGDEKSLGGIVEFLLGKLRYESFLDKHYPEDFEARWANVKELVSQAAEFSGDLQEEDDALPEIEGVQQQQSGMSKLMRSLELFLANVALASEVKKEEEEGEAGKEGQVTISTIHAAKGLEWPIVFIPAVYEGSIPHSRAEDTDEERRLLYVAMTRAQILLYMSCATRNSLKEKTKLSPFLEHKSLSPLLEKRGPKLTFSTVQSLLAILGRPCPPESLINMVIEKEGIPSMFDDQHPEKEPWEETSDGEEGDWRKKKRRKLEEAGGYGQYRGPDANVRGGGKARGWEGPVGMMTTEDRLRQQHAAGGMTTAERLALATAGGGFKSAQSHMIELKKKQLACEADRVAKEKRKAHDALLLAHKKKSLSRDREGGSAALTLERQKSKSTIVRSTTTTTTNKKKISSNNNQGSLLSYFHQKLPATAIPPREKTATEVLKSLTTTTKLKTSLAQQMQSLPQPRLPVRPSTLSCQQDFVLLSSSPPRRHHHKKPSSRNSKKDPSPDPPSSPAFEAFLETVVDNNDDKDLAQPCIDASSVAPAELTRTLDTTTDRTRDPASAGDSESVVRVNRAAGGGGIKPASARGGVRKTLGIRRSLGDGWANRASAAGNRSK